MNVSNSLIGSLGSSLLTNTTSATSSTGVGATATARPSSVPPGMGGAGSTSISTPGQFFSQMQQLSQQNPTEFKSVAAQVAKVFQTAASEASGPQAQVLTNLANQLTQAAQTGTLQSAQPAEASQATQSAQTSPSAGGARGHHHHHRHGAGKGSMSQSSGVQQAFQSAMQVLTQATSSGGSSLST
jgi:hypothetical protein